MGDELLTGLLKGDISSRIAPLDPEQVKAERALDRLGELPDLKALECSLESGEQFACF